MGSKQLTLLISILVVASITRLWQLGSNPMQLNRDEAALAYNAVLLHEKGVDEWGRRFPLSLQSFGDYKLIGYPLILSFLFQFFPQEDWVVRLPSAISGIVLVYLLFVAGKRIGGIRTGLSIAGLAAITPALIFFSRIAFEANLALTFMLAGLLLFLQKTDKPYQLFIGVFFLLLAACTYNTPLLLLPAIVVLFIFYFRKDLYSSPYPLIAFAVYILGSVVLFLSLLDLTAQKSAITIFSDPTIINAYPAFRAQFPLSIQPFFGNIYVYYAYLMSLRFVGSISPEFLINAGGTHPWHTVPGFGHITLVEYMLAASGIFYALMKVVRVISTFRVKILFSVSKQKKFFTKLLNTKISIAIIFLSLVTLLPSIVTVDSPHATRSLAFFVVLIVTAGWILPLWYLAIKKRYTRDGAWILVFASISLLLFQSGTYLYAYLTSFIENQPRILRTGYKKALVTAIQKNPTAKIAVVDPEGYDYILAAWYVKMNPDVFLQTIVRQDPNQIGFRYGEKIDRFHFIANIADRSDEELAVVFNENNYAWEVIE